MSDVDGTIADFHNDTRDIFDLASSSSELEEEGEADSENENELLADSQNSLSTLELSELDSQEMDSAELTRYCCSGFDECIRETERALHTVLGRALHSDGGVSLKDTIERIELKMTLSDNYTDKATFVKDNEARSRQRDRLIRGCRQRAIDYALEVPTDCAPFIARLRKSPSNLPPRASDVNVLHSRLMLWYFASCDCYGKHLIARRKYSEAVAKYTQCIRDKLRHYASVHASVVLHWKCFCLCNLAFALRKLKTAEATKDAKQRYEESLLVLDKLQRAIGTLSVAKHKSLAKSVLNNDDINQQRAYARLELGHTLSELGRRDHAIESYAKAAQLAGAFMDLIDIEFKAHWSTALVLYEQKEFRRAVHVLQTDCRRTITSCLLRFGTVEFRIKEFDVERYAAESLMSLREFKCARAAAKRMMRIASQHLSKHTKYVRVAKQMVAECQNKRKCHQQIISIERSASSNSAQSLFQALRRHYALCSWRSIVDHRAQCLSLFRQWRTAQGADTRSRAVLVALMLGRALKEQHRHDDALDVLQKAFDVRGVDAGDLNMARIAREMCQAMERKNVPRQKRLAIMLRGSSYVRVANAKQHNDNILTFKISFLQNTLRLYTAKHDTPQIQQIRRNLKLLREQHARRNPQTVSHRHRRRDYRPRQYRRQQQSSKPQIESCAFGIESHNSNDAQRRRRQRAMSRQYQNYQTIAASKRARLSRNVQNQQRTDLAKRYAGLNAQCSAASLRSAIRDIERILNGEASDIVRRELSNLRLLYVEHLSVAALREERTEQRRTRTELNPQRIVDGHANAQRMRIGKNNVIGVTEEPFEWLFRDRTRAKQWTPFAVAEAQEIEGAFQNGDSSVFVLRRGAANASFKVNLNVLGAFKTMTVNGSKSYVQRRVMPGALSMGKVRGWSAMWMRDAAHSSLRRFALNAHSQATRVEYSAVCALLRNRGLGGALEVHRVERVQNTAIQTRFLNSQIGSSQLRLLFHGTRASVVDGIVDEGTDFRLHGENGTRFGYGSYFAVYASYAAQFANEAEVDARIGRSVRYLFLCAVKVGEFCEGREHLRRPPKREDGRGMYDSVVDDVEVPSVFVTFDNAQALPMYLITFSFDAAGQG